MSTQVKPITHTAPPWHVDDSEGFDSIGITNDAGEQIAAVFNVAESEGFDPECRANAALISAAPQLYAACVKLLSCEISDALVLAGVAVRKAEGE